MIVAVVAVAEQRSTVAGRFNARFDHARFDPPGSINARFGSSRSDG
jgi:hypothetical protein